MEAMHWASKAIEQLKEGKNAIVCPKGNSMEPRVKSGAEVVLEPVNPSELNNGDIVLVCVGRNIYLHLISSVDKDRVQISNNRGNINGWVNKENVFGKAIVIDNSK